MLPYEKRHYSKNQQYYLIFQHDSNLVLRNSTDNAIIWETSTSAVDDNQAFQGSICILHNDGNIVIYKNKNPIWHSVRAPLKVCAGHCNNDLSCSLGLKCYHQDGTGLDRSFHVLESNTDQPSLRSAPSTVVRMTLQ